MYLLIKQIRELGSQIVLGKGADARVYHFKPRDPKVRDANHTCNVEDQRDLATLLAIPEGYCIDPNQDAPGAAIAEPKPAVKPAAPPPPPPAPASTAPAAADGETNPPTTDSTQAPAGTVDRADLLKRASDKAGKELHKSTSTKKLLEILGE